MAAQVITAGIGRTNKLIEIVETLPVPFNTVPISGYLTPSFSFVNGAAGTALAINQWFVPASAPITLAASASVTYTLTALTDALGRSVSFAGGVRIWGILVTARTAGDFLAVGAAASNPWTAWITGTTPAIKVYDFFALAVGSTDKYAVSAGSNEQIKVTNSGSNPITFNFIMAGCLT